MSEKPNIYVLCPDHSIPIGGIKQLYRHVDVLNKNGFSAFLIHNENGHRCTWFKNNTKVAYTSEVKINGLNDYLVVPETYGQDIADIGKNVKKVIFNQNCYQTFSERCYKNSKGYSFDINDFKTPYLDERVVATMVASDDAKKYLNFVFPKIKVSKVRYGFDSKIFSYCSNKKRQIAFMARKLREDAIQVVNILKFRRTFKDFDIVAIENKSESEVADILKESLIFLSFNNREGFGMPPVEAMACGCIVIGYSGRGGKEYLKPEFSYPVKDMDIIGFVEEIEKVINEYGQDREGILSKGKKASEYVLNVYSMEMEEEDIVGFWKQIMQI